ncbi:hypothetical protein Q5O89_15580 [Peribacillus frigoritolerans]|nr:hypothetical protein [Peribacillus frigoritolerans]
MYPLDMLDLTDGSKFVFGINEDTAIDVVKTSKGLNLKSNNTGFSRWNSLDLQFVCVNKKDRKHILETKEAPNQLTKGSLPDNVFLLDSYKPMYVQEKQALITLFGEDTYRFIMKKSEELFRDILPSPI